MVETLYGVMHGKSLNVLGVRVADYDIRPSKELAEELFALPPNTSVGIEHTPELERTFKINSVPVTTGANSNYWKKIRKICESGHLNIVYLEDFPTYKKHVEKLIEAKKATGEHMKNYMEFHRKNPTKTIEEYEGDEAARTIIRKAYKAGVEAVSSTHFFKTSFYDFLRNWLA